MISQNRHRLAIALVGVLALGAQSAGSALGASSVRVRAGAPVHHAKAHHAPAGAHAARVGRGRTFR